jgi:hypothetical protein
MLSILCVTKYTQKWNAQSLPYLRMSSKDVTLDFLSNWDINSLMDPISQNITPVWSEILDATTEGNESKIREKGLKSRNRHMV